MVAGQTPFENLRHVRGQRTHTVGAIYHLRASTARRTPFLASDKCKRIVLDTLRHAAVLLDFDLIAYVIMPDHVHIVTRPRGDKNISDFMASFNKRAARCINERLGRKGPI